MNDDPFAVLGLTESATVDDVRAARKELARLHHPDHGGDGEAMRTVNEAADAALERLVARSPAPPSPPSSAPPSRQPSHSSPVEPLPDDAEPTWDGVARDTPSFTVEALPVETYEGLLVVASWIGEVIDDDPPYRLEVQLNEPVACWCRLDVVPDAGASTVSLTIAGLDGAPTPDVLTVRDLWVDQLNRVDWA